jgi:hypothetical protein
METTLEEAPDDEWASKLQVEGWTMLRACDMAGTLQVGMGDNERMTAGMQNGLQAPERGDRPLQNYRLIVPG